MTIDEIGALGDLHLTTRVNGELRQDDLASNMHFSIEYQIHYLSTFVGLDAGDVIFTGTPTGAGARFDPPRLAEARRRRGGDRSRDRHPPQRRARRGVLGQPPALGHPLLGGWCRSVQ